MLATGTGACPWARFRYRLLYHKNNLKNYLNYFCQTLALLEILCYSSVVDWQ